MAAVAAVVIALLALLRGLFEGNGARTGEVESLKVRVASLERKSDEMNVALAQVQRDVAVIPAMNGKMDALDRLMTFRLDELGQQMRQIAVAVSAPIVMPAPNVRRGHPAQLPPVQEG